jgi:hypothetical protein
LYHLFIREGEERGKGRKREKEKGKGVRSYR